MHNTYKIDAQEQLKKFSYIYVDKEGCLKELTTTAKDKWEAYRKVEKQLGYVPKYHIQQTDTKGEKNFSYSYLDKKGNLIELTGIAKDRKEACDKAEKYLGYNPSYYVVNMINNEERYFSYIFVNKYGELKEALTTAESSYEAYKEFERYIEGHLGYVPMDYIFHEVDYWYAKDNDYLCASAW